jgi:hypothetical protein
MAMGRALEPAGANKTNGSINGVKLTTEWLRSRRRFLNFLLWSRWTCATSVYPLWLREFPLYLQDDITVYRMRAGITSASEYISTVNSRNSVITNQEIVV